MENSNVSGKEKGYIIIFLILVFLYCNYKTGKNNRKGNDAKSPTEKCLSEWDGSHPEMTREVKAMLNNPASFEHLETRYIDRGQEIDLIMKFTGTNNFGGVVTNTATATIDNACNIIKGPVIL